MARGKSPGEKGLARRCFALLAEKQSAFAVDNYAQTEFRGNSEMTEWQTNAIIRLNATPPAPLIELSPNSSPRINAMTTYSKTETRGESI